VNDQSIQFDVTGDAELVSPEKTKTEAGIASALIKIGSTISKVTVSASWKNVKKETNVMFALDNK